MNMNSVRKLLSVIGVFVLIAALALNFTGCGSALAPTTPPTESTLETEQENTYKHTFTLTVVDLEGKETNLVIMTNCEYVGEALLDEGIITGDMGDYGIYINTVNGIAADWDKDQTYWAFYINDEYALTGVDTTPIEENTLYSLVLTKG